MVNIRIQSVGMVIQVPGNEFNELLGKVPFEIRNAVRALDCDMNWAILILLIEDGPVRVSKIAMAIGLSKPHDYKSMRPYTNALKSSGLIEEYSETLRDMGDPEYSYYRATETARRMMIALMKGLSIDNR